ncbi:uncharacterized protein LOC119105639 [Pollicipes pollicipes]|uniref:uncharacterized protein LOC119105639 n=1 Tax=Pollicipes pollicipes TaxID=41117 RepID=UPI00188586AD|nr:uncharacterized protein LOC119105639 [Pollicipes pollicipes]
MQLEPGCCLFELHVQLLTLTAEARRQLGEAGVFLTWMFYNQDIHYTPVMRGDLNFDCSSLYKLFVDRALIQYLANEHVTLEVHRTEGEADCRQLGTAALSCREILQYPSNRLHGTAELAGLGTLVYWFRADGPLQEFLQRAPPADDARRMDGDAGRGGDGAGDQTIVAGSPDISKQERSGETAPPPPPRHSGYATYTESSASDASSCRPFAGVSLPLPVVPCRA